jgi:hypothetical protein
MGRARWDGGSSGRCRCAIPSRADNVAAENQREHAKGAEYLPSAVRLRFRHSLFTFPHAISLSSSCVDPQPQGWRAAVQLTESVREGIVWRAGRARSIFDDLGREQPLISKRYVSLSVPNGALFLLR